MSNFQPVAFSPVEHGSLRAHERTQAELENVGLEVVRFPLYDGNPEKHLELTEDILSRTGGLLLGGYIASARVPYVDQAGAVLDRINRATELQVPIFTPNSNWLKSMRVRVRDELIMRGGVIPLLSASGVSTLHILDSMQATPTGPDESPPYATLKEKLTLELNTAGRK